MKRTLQDQMLRYVEGDPMAFDAVYAELAPQVRRRARRLVGPDLADDLTQQTFLKMHRARHTWQQSMAVEPWVMTIARHAAVDLMRASAARPEAVTSDGRVPEAGAGDAGCEACARDARDAAVRAAVDELPAGQRSVVALHKLEGRSFEDVADALGIKPGAARVRAHRAYARLRDALSDWVHGAPEPA